jgi:hypothetical protein
MIDVEQCILVFNLTFSGLTSSADSEAASWCRGGRVVRAHFGAEVGGGGGAWFGIGIG